MPFSDEQKLAYVQEILKIWDKRIDEKLSFTTIIEEAEKREMKKETVIDYLKKLTGEDELFEGLKRKILERTKEGKYVYYKPVSGDLYFGLLGISKGIWAPPEKYLTLCYDVNDVVTKRFNEAIKLLEKDQTFQRPKKLERLNVSSVRLMDTLKKSLCCEFHAGSDSTEEAFRSLWQNVTEVVSAYMELWTLTQGFGYQKRMGKRMEYLKAKLEEYLPDDVDAY